MALALALMLCLSACIPSAKEPVPAPAEPSPLPVQEVDFTVRMDGAVYCSTPELTIDRGNVLGTLRRGMGVLLREERPPFYLVELPDGKQGWMHEWYLELPDKVAQRRRDMERLRTMMASESFLPPEDGETHSYTCMANLLNCRERPSLEATVVHQISFGTEVTVLGQDGDFFLCRLKDGGVAYCAAEYLTDEAFYAELDGAVDLRVYLPTADFSLRFASSDNITGEVLYPAVPLLETSAAEKLAAAQAVFRENGYSLIIYDAYRPGDAQDMLHAAAPGSCTGSRWHSLGRAVDVSLMSIATGKAVEMPTETGAVSAGAKANCDYLTEVMTAAGFQSVPGAWWHFEDQDEGAYMAPDLDFEALTYRPIADLFPAESERL